MSRIKLKYPKWARNIPVLRDLEMIVVPKIFGVTVSINTLSNGLCNLSCPACPVKTTPFPKDKRLMSLDMFNHILDLLQQRDKVKIRDLWPSFYNEPTLHPQMPLFLEELKRRKIPSYISSNLQSLRNVREIVEAGPTQFRVSISGWTQETYGRHHGGDVEKLKSNMRHLADFVAGTDVTVYAHFHKWLDNVHEEATVAGFAKELGFEFTSEWAWYKPPDVLVKALEEGVRYPGMEYLNLDVVLRGKTVKAPCRGVYKHFAIDIDGSMPLCCNMAGTVVGNFLDTSLKELQKRKLNHPACEGCYKWGLNVAYFNIDELS